MGGGGHPKGQVAVPGGGALQLVKSLVQLIQGQFDMVVELPPLVVETDVPSHPVKERDAQIRLQAADGGAERGWGDVELDVYKRQGLAHVAHHTGVVGVIAAVGGQVEGNGQTLLTGRQIAAVEGVGLLGLSLIHIYFPGELF